MPVLNNDKSSILLYSLHLHSSQTYQNSQGQPASGRDFQSQQQTKRRPAKVQLHLLGLELGDTQEQLSDYKIEPVFQKGKKKANRRKTGRGQNAKGR